MKHLKRFNEEFGRDEVVFTSQRNLGVRASDVPKGHEWRSIYPNKFR